jgi:acid phosphatase family membrane protein YuiD
MVNSFILLFSNSVFISSLSAFILSQILKGIITLFKIKDRKAKSAFFAMIWNTGGMPSSHSALVSAMACSAGIIEGFGSNIFAITFFFALVIIRDALGVRRASGLQSKALNNLGRIVTEKFSVEWQPVKEIQGHNPLEVVIGIVLGIVTALGFHFSRFMAYFV